MGNLENIKNNALPEFQSYLLKRKLVPEKNIPYFAYWVSRYLHFARKKELSSETFNESGVLEFLDGLRSDPKTLEWQPRQADEAVQLYYFYFLNKGRSGETGQPLANEIQSLLGHKNLETTMIYTHVLRNMSNAPISPFDALYGGES